MSRLYLLRHGEAEFGSDRDAQRRLTDRGITQVRQAAAKLPTGGLAVCYSPYVRAVESARLVLEHITAQSEQQADWLIPETPPGTALAQLESRAGQDLLLVTHNPLVTSLAAALSGEAERAVTFGTGSLARLDGDAMLPGCMTLVWL